MVNLTAVELRQIKSLVSLADLGNIHRVAGAVHLSSPSVHKHLKALESELNVPLYERNGRALRLTEAAQIILPYLRQMLAEHDTARRVLDEWKGVNRGLVRIGAGQIVGTYLVPRLLERLFARHPRVNASIQAAPVKPLVERLSVGQIDVAFLAVPELNDEEDISKGDVEIICDVIDLEMVFVSGIPVQSRRCSFASLARLPFVGYELGLGITKVMDRYFSEVGFRPSVVVRCDYTESIKVMIQKVPAASLLPLWAVQKEIDDGTLWRLKPRAKALSLRIVLACRKQRYAPPAVRAFIEIVRNYSAKQMVK